MRKFSATATLTGISLIAHMALACPPQTSPQQASAASVDHALRNELSAAQDASHPMQYHLRKSSPRLTTTKHIIETKDGLVALLVSVNDAPPSADDAQKDKTRLDTLLSDPEKQQHRKQSENTDTARAVKVLHVLPRAFLYQDAGPLTTPAGLPVERYTFAPNPKFYPPDLETTVLTQMTGEIWIDPAQQRVAHLEGQLQSDVDFGWGVLGRLYKGGSVAIDQADVGGGVWRVTRFQMKMSGRVFFKIKVFDTTEEETHFAPVSASLDYKQAIQMLRDAQKGILSDSR
jgi:hypothetical protein